MYRCMPLPSELGLVFRMLRLLSVLDLSLALAAFAALLARAGRACWDKYNPMVISPSSRVQLHIQ